MIAATGAAAFAADSFLISAVVASVLFSACADFSSVAFAAGFVSSVFFSSDGGAAGGTGAVGAVGAASIFPGSPVVSVVGDAVASVFVSFFGSSDGRDSSAAFVESAPLGGGVGAIVSAEPASVVLIGARFSFDDLWQPDKKVSRDGAQHKGNQHRGERTQVIHV